MGHIIPLPPSGVFIDTLRAYLLRYPAQGRRTSVILPAGDVCGEAREALADIPSARIYAFDEYVFAGDNGACGLAPLSRACGRFLAGALLDKADAGYGEKGAACFYRLLAEAERLCGDAAALPAIAEEHGFTDRLNGSARLFLTICGHWRAITREAGFISAAGARAEAALRALRALASSGSRERLITALAPAADKAVRDICLYAASSPAGAVFVPCANATLFEEHAEADGAPPYLPGGYVEASSAFLRGCGAEILTGIAAADDARERAAALWFAPADILAKELPKGNIATEGLPSCKEFPSLRDEAQYCAAEAAEAAAQGETVAIIVLNKQLAQRIDAALTASGAEAASVYRAPEAAPGFTAALDALFAHAGAKSEHGTPDTLAPLLRIFAEAEPSPEAREAARRAETVYRAACHDRGTAPPDTPAALAELPLMPADAEATRIFLHRLEAFCAPLRRLSRRVNVTAREWFAAFEQAAPALTPFLPPPEDGNGEAPSPAGCCGFLRAAGLRDLPLTSVRAFSLIREACAELFPQPQAEPRPGVPLICGYEHIRLIAPDTVIATGLTEDTYDTADTDAYLPALPGEAALLSPDARAARRASELLAALSAKRLIVTRSRAGASAPLRPARAFSRLALLHKAAGTAITPERQEARAPAETVTPPAPVPPAALREAAAAKPLHATQAEMLCRNPYMYYASFLLRLKDPRDPGEDTFHADYGGVIHEAAHAYALRYGEGGRATPEERAVRFAECADLAARETPGLRDAAARAACLARAAAAGPALAEDDEDERRIYGALFTEKATETAIDCGGSLRLKARCDRIALHDGEKKGSVTDIKTGVPPNKPALESGEQIQLAVALLTAARAFPGYDFRLRALYAGGGSGASVLWNEAECADLADRAEQYLQSLGAHFFFRADTAFPFTRAVRYGDAFAHLARYEEWRYGAA